MRLIISKNWVSAIGAFALSAALLVNAPAHAQKSYAAHTQEITRLAQANQAGQISIQPGDAFTVIAQRYARANNLPLTVAIQALMASNPNAFEDAQRNLKLGATLVIPLKADALKAVGQSGDAAPAAVDAVNSATPALVEPNAQTEVKPDTQTEAQPETPAAATQNPSAEPAADAASSPSEDASSTSIAGMSPWVVALLGMFGLMVVLGLVRGFKDPDDSPAEASSGSDDDAPKMHLANNAVSAEPTVAPTVESDGEPVPVHLATASNLATRFDDTEEVDEDALAEDLHELEAMGALDELDEFDAYDDLDELNELDAPATVSAPLPLPLAQRATESPDARFAQALGGLSALSLDLTSELPDDLPDDLPMAMPVRGLVERSAKLKIEGQAAAEPLVASTGGFFNSHFKTPFRQWLSITSASSRAATFANVKLEAMHAAQVPAEVLEQTSLQTLDMDVPKFLNEFSHRLPEPTFDSVDYEDLLDRARLQAWLNVQTPEQILIYAQDAYEARYEDVAQLMLNDVLLRGNAEQCTAVLNMRYHWSYPQGVY